VRGSHHLPLRGPGPIAVELELHWNLAQERRYRIDVAGLFERSVELTLEGRTVRRLEDHDLVAHLLVHHFSHYFDRRLKWLLDLSAVARQAHFRWALVAQRIRAWGAAVAAGISLMHLHRLWPELVPAQALELLPVAGWRRALTWPLRSRHPLELFRGTRKRSLQLYLAAVMLEQPAELPGWLRHRALRDRRAGSNPLDDGG
jgi:hypothetical protein